MYSYGARIDDDSNAITVIDEENKTAATTGYVNGEYVEFSGGGGSSDFSTAEVTVVNNYRYNAEIQVARANSEYLNSDTLAYANSNTTATISVILYKGTALGSIKAGEAFDWHIEVEGDAEVDESDVFITGDCTITIS